MRIRWSNQLRGLRLVCPPALAKAPDVPLLIRENSLRIFVSEFITSGALSGTELPASLLREGQAMLSAIVSDFAAIPGCHVTTTLDRRLVDSFDRATQDGLHVVVIDEAIVEKSVFDRHVLDADATLIIAPETDGILAQRVQRVQDLGAASLNCAPSAIEICGDKLRLAEHLQTQGIATIETRLSNRDGSAPWDRFQTAVVLKPRDGAGSWLTFRIPCRGSQAWNQAFSEFIAAGAAERAIVQPWIAGRALSAGCLCDSAGNVEVLPIASQHLTPETFQYQGGRIPAELPQPTVLNIQQTIRAACETIRGLRGYFGFDLLLPDSAPTSPLIVEINPRLTTSYVGYRQLCRGNLAAQMLGQASEPLSWKPSFVSFNVDGGCDQPSDRF